MKDGDLCARDYVTGESIRVQWRNGQICAVLGPNQPTARDWWIAPALVDLQINGYGGIDFQQDQTTLGDLVLASRRLRAAGCARYLLTLVTDAWPRLVTRLRHLRYLRERSEELRHVIAGWHIEGPFLSAEPGYCGAHDPAFMLDPAPEHIRELREIVGEDRVLLTIAPERSGAIAAIQQAVALGLKVSLGHTNAPAALLTQAVQQGAIGFTHLGNGCPRELDRHDNVLWRLFETGGLKVSLIPDTIHVSPALFRLIHRELGPEAIYYTTDAMAAAGMKPGRYKLGRLELEVGPDQIVRLPGRPNFAGSAFRPIDGIFRAASMLGCSWRGVWPRFSVAPATLMGLPCGLSAGMPADFCLLRVASDNVLSGLKVFARGEAQSTFN